MRLIDKVKKILTEQSNSGSGKNKVKFGSGAKGEFASGSPSMGGEDKTYVKQGKKPLKGKNVKAGQTTGTPKPKRGATTIRQTGQRNLFTGKIEKPQEVKVKTTYQKKTTKPIRVNKEVPGQGKLNFDSPRQIVKNLDKRDVQIKKLDQQIIKPKSGDAARTDKFIKRKQKSYDIQSKSTLKKAKKYAAGGYPKIGGGGLKPDIKPPVKGTTPVKTNVSKLNVDKIFSDKTKTKSGSTVVPKNITAKSKGTTPVRVNITKPVKQSEVSKKAKEFTAKVNKANVNVQKNYVGRKAVRIKDATLGKKTGSLRKGNLSFPGDRSGAYQATKSDIEARKGFKGAKTQTGAGKTKTIPGLKADEKNPFVKTSVRKGRAATLGGDIFKTRPFSQKEFEKSLKQAGGIDRITAGKKAVNARIQSGQIPDPFKASTTKTGSLVKNFKFQPRDVSAKTAADKVEKGIKSAKKSFSDFSKKLSGVSGKKTNVNISPTDAEIASLGYDPRKGRTVDKKYGPGTKGKVQMRGGASNIPAGPKTPPKKYNIPADDRPGKLVQGRDFASKKSYDAKLEKQIKILRGKADNLRKKQIKVAKTSPTKGTPEYKARSVNVKKIGARMRERTKTADALQRSLKRQGTTGPTSMLPVVSGKGADEKMPGMGEKSKMTYKQFYKAANVGKQYTPPKVKSTPKPPPIDPNIEDNVKKTYKKYKSGGFGSRRTANFGGSFRNTAAFDKRVARMSRGFSGGRGKRALAGKVGRFALGIAKKNPLLTTLAVGAAGIYGINKLKKAIAGPQLTSKDFTGSVIKDKQGKNVVFKNPTYNPATKKSDTEHRAGGYVTQKQLNKFKTGDYNISDKSGNKIDLDKRIKQSAFTKQLTKASKGTGFFGKQTQKDKDFLKKYKKAAEYRGIAVK